MSLEPLHWYVLDTDGATVVAAGTCQAAHIGSIRTEPGQTLRSGVKAHPLDVWEKEGRLIPYTPAEKIARRNPPGRGYVWRAGAKMGWEDRRPIQWAKEDKFHALGQEHAKRRLGPVKVGDHHFHLCHETHHRMHFAGASAPNQLRENDMRIRDANGILHTWDDAAEFRKFAQRWTEAAARHYADADRWKDDLHDRIDAARWNHEIDQITWEAT